jgi:hypothetical protein
MAPTVALVILEPGERAAVEDSGPRWRGFDAPLDAGNYSTAPDVTGAAATAGGRGGAAGTAQVNLSGEIVDYRMHILGRGIVLTAPHRDVPGIVARAANIADEHEGYVGSSSYDVREGSATGSIDVWVVTERVPEATEQLSELGTVVRTVEQSRDITASRADLVAQVRNDVETLASMRRSGGTDNASQQQIAALQALVDLRRQRLANLDRRVEMTLINLRIVGKEPVVEAAEPWSTRWALDIAGRVLQRTLATSIIAGAALLPVALVGALLALFVGWRRRKLRERALDRA